MVERRRGSASDLHALEMPDDGHRHVWILESTGPAVVLGSTQSHDVVDHVAAEAAGVAVARRRSGGGAVWVAPGEPIWVDVVIPRDDPLWVDDVGRAFLPVGRAWSRALDTMGFVGTTVHDGALLRTAWSDLVCFSGTGPGEVVHEGKKVVGISQRRSRAGARFQCAIPRHWDPAPLLSFLHDAPSVDVLATVGAGVGDHDRDALVDAFVRALG